MPSWMNSGTNTGAKMAHLGTTPPMKMSMTAVIAMSPRISQTVLRLAASRVSAMFTAAMVPRFE